MVMPNFNIQWLPLSPLSDNCHSLFNSTQLLQRNIRICHIKWYIDVSNSCFLWHSVIKQLKETELSMRNLQVVHNAMTTLLKFWNVCTFYITSAFNWNSLWCLWGRQRNVCENFQRLKKKTSSRANIILTREQTYEV